MAIGPLFNCRLFAGGADLTSRSNVVNLNTEVEEINVTTFKPEGDANSGWKEVIAGLRSSTLEASGFWEAGDPAKVDDNNWSGLGSVEAITVGPDGAAVADLAWVMQGLRMRYQVLGDVAQAAPWSANASGNGPLARGVMLNAPTTTLTTTTDGTAVEYIAASSTQRLYANLHVLTTSGESPLMTVIIESDVDANFDGSETTRITFTEVSEVGSEYKSVAGPITDTWYRVSVTTAGTSPSFTAVVAIGVQ